MEASISEDVLPRHGVVDPRFTVEVSCTTGAAATSDRAPERPAGGAHGGFTAALLAGEAAPSLSREAARFATGLSLAALYGAALGARGGLTSIAAHAAGVPLAILATSALGVPALYIVLALFDAPIDLARAGSAAARGAASAGLVLAGLAPAAALYVVSSDSEGVARLTGALGLAIGGWLGLSAFRGELGAAVAEAPLAKRALARLALAGFGVFAVALAVRIWSSVLPLFGGAS
jgi:hypothetical protein